MAKLKGRITAEEFAALDKALQALYEEHEESGDYLLDADWKGTPSETRLKDTLKKERKRANDAEKEAKAAKAAKPAEGDDEEEGEEEEAGDPKPPKQKEAPAGDPKPSQRSIQQERQRIRQQVEQELSEKRLKPVETERDALKAELRRLRLTDKVRAAFIKSGGVPEDADDVVRLTEPFFDLDEENAILVKDDDGEVSGLSPEKWFADVFKERKPKYFAAPDASGSGSGDNRKQAPTSTPANAQPKQGGGGVVKISREDARIPSKYRAAKDAAEKAGKDFQVSET